MSRKLLILVGGICTLFNFVASAQEELIERELVKELKKVINGHLPVSWVYSNEGGVIKYAELDIVGDEQKEIIYDRSIQGDLKNYGSSREVYYRSMNRDSFAALEGQIFLFGFHKKEHGKSIFLKASSGRNFDTPDEKAFTKTLTIQEVSLDGTVNKTHVINDDSPQEYRELWECSKFYFEKSSIESMKKKGFEFANPEFKWLSVKDFVSGTDQWKTFDGKEWSSLNEFEIEARTWSVHKDLITPEYLRLSRRVSKIQDRDDSYVKYEEIDLPAGYLTPKVAYDSLLDRMSGVDRRPASEEKPSVEEEQRDRDVEDELFDHQNDAEERTEESPDSAIAKVANSVTEVSNFPWIGGGLLFLGILSGLVFLLNWWKGRSIR